jgi:hypothetical protein
LSHLVHVGHSHRRPSHRCVPHRVSSRPVFAPSSTMTSAPRSSRLANAVLHIAREAELAQTPYECTNHITAKSIKLFEWVTSGILRKSGGEYLIHRKRAELAPPSQVHRDPKRVADPAVVLQRSNPSPISSPPNRSPRLQALPYFVSFFYTRKPHAMLCNRQMNLSASCNVD